MVIVAYLTFESKRSVLTEQTPFLNLLKTYRVLFIVDDGQYSNINSVRRKIGGLKYMI